MSKRGLKAVENQSQGMIKQAEVEFVEPHDKLDLDQFIFDKSFQIPRESVSVAVADEEKKRGNEQEVLDILQTYEEITESSPNEIKLNAAERLPTTGFAFQVMNCERS